jgi:NADP-dependent 3-hydroxy acid dehydrogenase YdfG
MRSVTDKVVVITGASRGIGAAIAKLFDREKAILVLCGRDNDALASVASLLTQENDRIITVVSDIQTEAGVKAIVDVTMETFGRIDYWINNAGVGFRTDTISTTQEQFETTFDTNVKAVFFSLKLVLPIMKAQKSGHVINISSGAARIGVPGMSVYAASKAALNVLSESAADEVRNDNVKVSVLCPGSTETTFAGRTPQEGASGPKRLRPEEVAEGVLFLAKQDEHAFTSMIDIRPLITRQ